MICPVQVPNSVSQGASFEGTRISRRRFSAALLAVGGLGLSAQFSAAGADPATAADLDRSVGSGFVFLDKLQENDGAFDSEAPAGVWTTARALLAFLGAGNVPDLGKYGLTVRKCVDWLIARQGSSGWFGPSDRGMRAHAATTLALSQACGVDPSADRRITMHSALTKAAAVVLAGQVAGKSPSGINSGGGWEAIAPTATGENLSATAPVLLALRGCADVGINIPPASFQRAVAFALRCYDSSTGAFASAPDKRAELRATAAGVVCLHAADAALANVDKLDASAKYLTSHESEIVTPDGYGGIAPLAALRLGGNAWSSVGQPILARIAKNQEKDGGWPEAALGGRTRLSRTAATASALAVLTMSYPLLPIYQR